MASIETLNANMAHWKERGKQEANSFDKFIFYWIAFNCFYSKKTQLSQESKIIEILQDDKSIDELFRKLIVGKEEMLKNLKNKCPILDERPDHQGEKIEMPEFTFKEILPVIYQIRCNLFHGNKSGDSQRDKDVITAALPVLELLVDNLCQ